MLSPEEHALIETRLYAELCAAILDFAASKKKVECLDPENPESHQAAQDYDRCFRRLMKAVHDFNAFILHGKIPDEP
jgi:hypothetical protein